MLLLWVGIFTSAEEHSHSHWRDRKSTSKSLQTHSCIHDKILEQQRRAGVNQYKITPQVYDSSAEPLEDETHGRVLLEESDVDKRQPIRIFLNYDAVGLSHDRDCRAPGEIVKVRDLSHSSFKISR